MNYEELVKALRCDEKCWDNRCQYLESSSYNWCNTQRLRSDVAAAIEELKAQLPKQGEIVRCRECRWGHLCIIGQHLGLDGFCSKGEREVQA